MTQGSAVGDVDDGAIRAIVTRLARPHASGGAVIERAAILSEGADSAAVIAWITAHEGVPETAAPAPPSGGLHGSRGRDAAPLTIRRFVLPPGVLD